jgi:uncharacterized protein YecE (DUF72 family)
MAEIRVGIGGWVYKPWRGLFYPKGLPQAQELEHASRRLTSIEINGTFYGAQKPASFRRWHAETPETFVFSVKGPRFATHRSDLRESKATIERFFGTGVLELGQKLGPIFWQFPATTKFDAANFAAFFALLPREIDGRRIRHAVEVRQPSFATPDAVALFRRHGVALVFVDGDGYLPWRDVTADFVYARLRSTIATEKTGYPLPALDTWAKRFRRWADGGEPDDVERVDPTPTSASPRDCFVYFISGAKERAPGAAVAMIERLAAR